MKKLRRFLTAAVTLLLILVVVFVLWKFKRAHYDIWFPAYVSQMLAAAPDGELRQGPLRIIFIMVDHFEPGKEYGYLEYWLERYRAVVDRHADCYGNPPRRTFYYPIEQFDSTEIEMILSLCRQGYGEIEVQLHHFDNDSTSVTVQLQQGLADFARFGICQTIDEPPLTRFSFVHGNWALDNSRAHQSPNPCGVNNEIKILASLGCYLDVTFPAIMTTAQPSRINSIYYVTDDPLEAKSYDDGIAVEVGKPAVGDLMLLEGPLMIDWDDWRFGTHPSIEDGNIFRDYPMFPNRIPLWLKANVHVIGQPNWVFVKLHSHGCRQSDSLALWGPSFDSTLTVLETEYNDGESYMLHYATVREAYNIIRAAAEGKGGNPEFYRDYIIKPFRANSPLTTPDTQSP
ncbi:MAG: hypothetical protein KAT58_00020 [candidate division Zixibacteria bacterium]|nr:hypothetical protein [candidate division Zixibacteria bacterium]